MTPKKDVVNMNKRPATENLETEHDEVPTDKKQKIVDIEDGVVLNAEEAQDDAQEPKNLIVNGDDVAIGGEVTVSVVDKVPVVGNDVVLSAEEMPNDGPEETENKAELEEGELAEEDQDEKTTDETDGIKIDTGKANEANATDKIVKEAVAVPIDPAALETEDHAISVQPTLKSENASPHNSGEDDLNDKKEEMPEDESSTPNVSEEKAVSDNEEGQHSGTEDDKFDPNELD